MVGMIHDVTEGQRAEEELKTYAKTQEVLLREVNHRVKNNLSALISILHKEEDRAEASGNSSYSPLLNELIGRIQGLSTVHSMLSASGWKPIRCSELCRKIIGGAMTSIHFNKDYNIKIQESEIEISSTQAHHLTLVLNELATNTMKHSKNNGEILEISVIITRSNGQINIAYKDNGCGYPESILKGDRSKANIGFGLIKGIVEQSLQGDLEIRNDNGAVTEIKFELEN